MVRLEIHQGSEGWITRLLSDVGIAESIERLPALSHGESVHQVITNAVIYLYGRLSVLVLKI